jgi:5'-nucleotidase
VVSKSADNLIVQSEAYTASSGEVGISDLYPRYQAAPDVAAIVARYQAIAQPLAARVVGRLGAPADRKSTPAGEQVLGNLIADAQLAATRAPDRGGAQIAFMNSGGIRADIVPAPDGAVTFGQIYQAQPFSNTLIVKTMTGRQIRELLEQQFASGLNSVENPNVLLPSSGFSFSYDLGRPAGQRVTEMRLGGELLAEGRAYRVTMNSFLASGGDDFPAFREGTDQVGGAQDVEALEAYLTANPRLTPPATDRIRNLTPQPAGGSDASR